MILLFQVVLTEVSQPNSTDSLSVVQDQTKHPWRSVTLDGVDKRLKLVQTTSQLTYLRMFLRSVER